jgi:hypothetical protein
LVLSAAAIIMLIFSGLAWAMDSDAPEGDVRGGAGDSGRQAEAAPNCDQQGTLEALSSPELAGRSAEDNGKLLSRFLECGGTIASLPEGSFATLLMQGVIELRVVEGSGMIACAATGEGGCSDIPG